MTKKKEKKSSYTQSELDEVNQAMKSLGMKTLTDFVLFSARNTNKTDVEKRKADVIIYRYKELHTLHNKIAAGIEVEKNMKDFIERGEALCQELM